MKKYRLSVNTPAMFKDVVEATDYLEHCIKRIKTGNVIGNYWELQGDDPE